MYGDPRECDVRRSVFFHRLFGLVALAPAGGVIITTPTGAPASFSFRCHHEFLVPVSQADGTTGGASLVPGPASPIRLNRIHEMELHLGPDCTPVKSILPFRTTTTCGPNSVFVLVFQYQTLSPSVQTLSSHCFRLNISLLRW